MKKLTYHNIEASVDDALEDLINTNLEYMENDDFDHVSNGHHTFEDLYNQRLILTAVIVNTYPYISWKTKRDEYGEPWFDDTEDMTNPDNHFLVSITTPKGEYGYHYHNRYWNMFNCKELARSNHWDGYTSDDVDRLLSLI